MTWYPIASLQPRSLGLLIFSGIVNGRWIDVDKEGVCEWPERVSGDTADWLAGSDCDLTRLKAVGLH